jgi:hypothetical protein
MGVRPASLTLGALVVGSVVAVDPAGLAPFGPARWGVVSVLGTLGGGLALWTSRRRLDRTTGLLWLGLLALLALGALLGGDVPTAVLGEPTRHLGLVTWVILALLFCAGQQLDSRDVRSITRAVVVATAALDLWALWERVVGRPIDVDVRTDRLLGPFGSAAVLGAACCLLVPICLGVGTDRSERTAWRAVATATTVVGGWVMICSSRRSRSQPHDSTISPSAQVERSHGWTSGGSRRV